MKSRVILQTRIECSTGEREQQNKEKEQRYRPRGQLDFPEGVRSGDEACQGREALEGSEEDGR